MNVKIEVQNLKDVKRDFQVIAVGIKIGTERGMKLAANAVQRASQVAITTPPTKAIDTGRLRGSIRIVKLTPELAIIKPNVNYAGYVHWGTKRMQPRPYMSRGAEEAKPTIQKIIKNEIIGALK